MAIGTVQLGITIYFAAAGLLEDHPQLGRGRLEHVRRRPSNLALARSTASGAMWLGKCIADLRGPCLLGNGFG